MREPQTSCRLLAEYRGFPALCESHLFCFKVPPKASTTPAERWPIANRQGLAEWIAAKGGLWMLTWRTSFSKDDFLGSKSPLPGMFAKTFRAQPHSAGGHSIAEDDVASSADTVMRPTKFDRRLAVSAWNHGFNVVLRYLSSERNQAIRSRANTRYRSVSHYCGLWLKRRWQLGHLSGRHVLYLRGAADAPRRLTVAATCGATTFRASSSKTYA